MPCFISFRGLLGGAWGLSHVVWWFGHTFMVGWSLVEGRICLLGELATFGCAFSWPEFSGFTGENWGKIREDWRGPGLGGVGEGYQPSERYTFDVRVIQSKQIHDFKRCHKTSNQKHLPVKNPCFSTPALAVLAFESFVFVFFWLRKILGQISWMACLGQLDLVIALWWIFQRRSFRGGSIPKQMLSCDFFPLSILCFQWYSRFIKHGDFFQIINIHGI